jgi:hypothetical protein
MMRVSRIQHHLEILACGFHWAAELEADLLRVEEHYTSFYR